MGWKEGRWISLIMDDAVVKDRDTGVDRRNMNIDKQGFDKIIGGDDIMTSRKNGKGNG